MWEDYGLMKRLKVLQISKLYYPWVGGVEKVVQDIAEGLRDKVDMEVLACRPMSRGSTQLLNGVKVVTASSFGVYWGMPVSFTFPLLVGRESRKADILHFHLPFPLGDLSYLLLGARKNL